MERCPLPYGAGCAETAAHIRRCPGAGTGLAPSSWAETGLQWRYMGWLLSPVPWEQGRGGAEHNLCST